MERAKILVLKWHTKVFFMTKKKNLVVKQYLWFLKLNSCLEFQLNQSLLSFQFKYVKFGLYLIVTKHDVDILF